MENEFEKALEKFWIWAGITPEEYAKGEIPKIGKQAEWEVDYPDWLQLESLFRKELEHFKKNLNYDQLENILEFVAIDNESGSAIDTLIEELDISQQLVFVKVGCNYKMPQTRWQIADFLSDSNVANKKEILEKMVSYDSDKYVQRRALLSLQRIDSILACEYAFKKLSDEEEYLRLVSLRILKDDNSYLLKKAINLLKDDPSSLIQKELDLI